MLVTRMRTTAARTATMGEFDGAARRSAANRFALDERHGIAAAIPGAKFVVIAGASQIAPLENPAAINAALDKFLARS